MPLLIVATVSLGIAVTAPLWELQATRALATFWAEHQ